MTIGFIFENVSAARTDQLLSRRARRWLYRFYHRGTAANYYLRKHMRPAGIGLMILGVILAFLATGQINSVLFRIVSFAFTLGLMALLWLPFRRARIEVTRDLPQHATAGVPLRLRYRVKNVGRRLSNAWLTESAPDPRPDVEQFVRANEPGGEQRNLYDRFFSYYCWTWLCEIRMVFDPEPSKEPLNLERGQEQTVVAEIMPRRRGLVTLNTLNVVLPDPFGFFQRHIKVPTSNDTLAILPRRYPLPDIELPGSARFQPGGDATSRNTGPSGEFVALRDYQPGDPPRLIHWKSWARTGKPVVKELEDSFFPRHGLVLDTFPEAGDEHLFEDAVSVAASFVSAIDTHECLVDLMVISGHERVVTAGRGIGRSESLLEVLAGVESSSTPEFDSLQRMVYRHAEDLAGCLAVFAGWSDERYQLLKRIENAGIEIAAIAVSREIPEKKIPGVYFVKSSRLADDLMRLPVRL